jgi:hypothetical protein
MPQETNADGKPAPKSALHKVKLERQGNATGGGSKVKRNGAGPDVLAQTAEGGTNAAGAEQLKTRRGSLRLETAAHDVKKEKNEGVKAEPLSSATGSLRSPRQRGDKDRDKAYVPALKGVEKEGGGGAKPAGASLSKSMHTKSKLERFKDRRQGKNSMEDVKEEAFGAETDAALVKSKVSSGVMVAGVRRKNGQFVGRSSARDGQKAVDEDHEALETKEQVKQEPRTSQRYHVPMVSVSELPDVPPAPAAVHSAPTQPSIRRKRLVPAQLPVVASLVDRKLKAGAGSSSAAEQQLSPKGTARSLAMVANKKLSMGLKASHASHDGKSGLSGGVLRPLPKARKVVHEVMQDKQEVVAPHTPHTSVIKAGVGYIEPISRVDLPVAAAISELTFWLASCWVWCGANSEEVMEVGGWLEYGITPF